MIRNLVALGIAASLGTSWLYAQANTPTFEVASIKPNVSDQRGARVSAEPNGRVTITNIQIGAFILGAYGLQDYFQMEGAPEWTRVDRFDIIAKAPDGVSIGSPLAGSGDPVSPLQLMQRALLAERFKFAAHLEQREVPMYAAIKARQDGRLGPNLTVSNTDCAAWRAAQARSGTPPPAPGERRPCGMSGTIGSFAAGAITLSQFVTLFLAPRLGRPVVDRTGLAGNYDVLLTFRPDPPPDVNQLDPSALGDADAPSLLAALEEQLGLKIESTRGSVEVLVVDHIERPTPN